jgi:hypothetical protein
MWPNSRPVARPASTVLFRRAWQCGHIRWPRHRHAFGIAADFRTNHDIGKRPPPWEQKSLLQHVRHRSAFWKSGDRTTQSNLISVYQPAQQVQQRGVAALGGPTMLTTSPSASENVISSTTSMGRSSSSPKTLHGRSVRRGGRPDCVGPPRRLTIAVDAIMRSASAIRVISPSKPPPAVAALARDPWREPQRALCSLRAPV